MVRRRRSDGGGLRTLQRDVNIALSLIRRGVAEFFQPWGLGMERFFSTEGYAADGISETVCHAMNAGGCGGSVWQDILYPELAYCV